MENLPVEREDEVIEPEIVGMEPPRASLWRRILVRVAAGLILGILGIGLCIAGGVLTLTLIGAAIGIPLICVGVSLIVLAVFLFIGGEEARTIDLRFPRP